MNDQPERPPVDLARGGGQNPRGKARLKPQNDVRPPPNCERGKPDSVQGSLVQAALECGLLRLRRALGGAPSPR